MSQRHKNRTKRVLNKKVNNPAKRSIFHEKAFYILSILLIGVLAVAISNCGDPITDPLVDVVDDTTKSPLSLPDGMVLIPAGEFQMGSNDPEADNDEQPVRTMFVNAFYTDETEVTNAAYQTFLLENPRWQKGRVDARFADVNYLHLWNGNNYPSGKGNHPVVHVSWYAVMAYAEWTGKRLPTEAEWEYAARGGLVGRKYPNGNTLTPRDANYGENVGDTTAVGRYPGNGYGLYDMAGNVWEWCLDTYDSDFYSTFPRGYCAQSVVRCGQYRVVIR